MEESDSEREDDPPARATDVPYPLEGKYIDEADKRKIMGMSQLDREEILGQRAEEMSRANFTAELARRAANLHNDRKRKVDSEEPDEGSSSRRPKVKARVNDKLEEYKRNREQRGQQRDRDADRLNSRRRSSSGDRDRDRDGPSDMDADGESDVDAVVDEEGNVASFAFLVELLCCRDEDAGVGRFVTVLDCCDAW